MAKLLSRVFRRVLILTDGDKTLKLQQVMWLLPLWLSLSACMPVRQNMVDGKRISLAEGILVARVIVTDSVDPDAHAPIVLSLINTNSITVADAVMNLDDRENFIAIPLRAGHYSWRGIYFNDGEFSEFRNKMPFDITAGQINYVGDITIRVDWDHKSFGIKTRDLHQYTLPILAARYPNLWANYPVVTHMSGN